MPPESTKICVSEGPGRGECDAERVFFSSLHNSTRAPPQFRKVWYKLRQELLQIATRSHYKLRQGVITNCDKVLLKIVKKMLFQIATRFYRKLRQGVITNYDKVLLQIATRVTTNCNKVLLQIATGTLLQIGTSFITNNGRYYKL